MSSGQGGLLRALSVAHSSELGAEAPCGCARSGEGPVDLLSMVAGDNGNKSSIERALDNR